MGIGREVADAYIDVHGDLSSFRRDLGKAEETFKDWADGLDPINEETGQRMGDLVARGFGDRLRSQLDSQWRSVLDSLHSGDKIDFNRMIGNFDSSDLDSASEKIHQFLDGIREAGVLSSEEADKLKKAVDTQIRETYRQQFIESDLAKDRAMWTGAQARMMEDLTAARKRDADELIRLNENMLDGEKRAAAIRSRLQEEASRENIAWNERRKRTMTDAIRENERWARTFEGISKNDAIKNLNEDFTKLSKAMTDGDIGKWGNRLEGDFTRMAQRVREVTGAMLDQRRISDEDARAMVARVDTFIQGQNAQSKAMKDALDETNRLKEAQDRYNRSLRGMSEAFHNADMEAKFKQLAAAIDSNDWSKMARGAKDMEELRNRTMETANEMHRLGRMSDADLSMVSARLKNVHVQFREATKDADGFGTTMRNVLTRTGSLFSRLNTVTRGFREHLGGFAGLNVFGDMIEGGLEFIHNLDRVAVSLSKNTLLMGTMASVGGSAFAGLITIAADLGGIIGGLGVALPAFAVGAGIGIGVLVAAFKDTKKVLADLKPAFAELQNQISGSFWKEAAGPIRDAVNALMPILTPNLKGTATSLGGLVGKLATAFKDIPTESLNTMFERMNKSIDILGNAMPPLVRAFTTLGLVGSKYFERFTTWMVKLSDQFDAFIQKSAANGDLDKWINNMIEGFKNLGRVVDGTFGIFNALNSAAERAGFGGLKTFADSLQRAAAAMQEVGFQNTLVTYFEGVREAALKVGAAFAGLGPAAQSFAETAKFALVKVGDAVSKLIGYVGDIFSNPVFQTGVKNFTAGLDEAVRRLEPAVKPFGDSLGRALSLLGQIVISVADVATAFFVVLSPVLDSMSAKLETLVTPLRDGMVKAITDLKPIFEGIDQNILTPLVKGITEGLLPALTGPDGLTEKLGKVGEGLTKNIGDIIEPFVKEGGILPEMVRIVGELLGPLGFLFDLFTPALRDIIDGIAKTFGVLADALQKFNEKADPAYKAMGKINDKMREMDGFKLSEDTSPMANLIAKYTFAAIAADPVIASMAVFWGKISAGWTSSLSSFITLITDPKTYVVTLAATLAKNLPSWMFEGFSILDFAVAVGTWLHTNIYVPLQNAWKSFLITLALIFTGGSDTGGGVVSGGSPIGGRSVSAKIMPQLIDPPSEKSFLDTFIGDVGGQIGGWGTVIDGAMQLWQGSSKLSWDNFWGGLPQSTSGAMETSSTEVATGTGGMGSSILGFITANAPKWAGFFTGAKDDATTNMDAARQAIAGKTGEMGLDIQAFTSTSSSTWGGALKGMSADAAEKWGNMAGTTDKKTGEMQGEVSSMAGTVQGDWMSMLVQMSGLITSHFQAFVNVVMNKAGEIVGWVGGLPSRISSAMGYLGNLLSYAGSAIMQSLYSGLVGSWSMVTDFVGGIASWIAANKGPISYDRVLLQPAGEAIMGGLDRGIRNGMDPLLNTLQTITAAVTDTVTADLSHSVMYATGRDAAQGLADGLKANRTSVHTALGNLGAFTVPSSNILVSGGAAVGRPTADAVSGRSVTIAEGAIKIETPTKDPELVAAKVIDRFVNYSTF